MGLRLMAFLFLKLKSLRPLAALLHYPEGKEIPASNQLQEAFQIPPKGGPVPTADCSRRKGKNQSSDPRAMGDGVSQMMGRVK
jgi:hypothetical protein